MSAFADATSDQATFPVKPQSIVWSMRFADLLVLVRAHPGAKIIWMGDSITASWEHRGRHDYDNIRPLWLKYYAPYGALDLGIPGDTTSNLIWRLDHGQLAGLHPQLVIILIGANNIKGPTWGASETVSGIEKVVSITRANLPGSHVLLLGVLPAARSVWGYQQTSIVNMTLAKDYVNDPKVTFVDAGSTLLVDGRADSSLYLDPKMVPPQGALHPDAAGMAKIAAFIDCDVKRFTK